MGAPANHQAGGARGQDQRPRAGGVEGSGTPGGAGLFPPQPHPPGGGGPLRPKEGGGVLVGGEKDDNKWVQIREDGCVWVVAKETHAWTKTEHCGFTDFKGWCWLDNVSKDEYAGHMLALAALLRLVDEAEGQATVRHLLGLSLIHI